MLACFPDSEETLVLTLAACVLAFNCSGHLIFCRGVVQLFNAVQKHQKNVDEKVKEAGGSVRKRAKLVSSVSKRDFISVLRGMDGTTSEKSSPGKNPKNKQVRPCVGFCASGISAF